MAKADLQARATELGLSFVSRTTVAELEAMIAEATATPEVAEKFAHDEQPGSTAEEQRNLMRLDRRNRHEARLEEEAEASLNRAKDRARAEGRL